MDGSAASPDTAADQKLREKDAHLTNLIIQKREAAKRIEALEGEVADLRKQLQQATTQGLYAAEAGLLSDSVSEKTALKNARLTEISSWNEELIHTVEHLQRSLIHLEADSKAQLITLTDRLNQFREDNERLLRENDSLKARVGDDVLRQRQTNRIEIAFERARIAARVRAAGLQRLEAAEASLMEAHDDVYHVQRWDAVLLPQRDVSFVFHFVSNATFPLRGIEEFTMRVYQQFLFHSCSCCRGYRVGTYEGMEVFVFQAPADALLFAKECHEQLVRLSWSPRIETVPSFATISEFGTVLYRGPRIHTCVFACSPESYVDPVSGRYAFFGPEVAEAVHAAVEQAPIGEIAVNDRWAHLMCLHQRLHENLPPPTASGVELLRECLGAQWDVVSLPGAYHVIASLLPAALRSRRGVQAPVLHPSRKYPCLEVRDGPSVVRLVVKAMKGMLANTAEAPEESGRRPFSVGGSSGGSMMAQQMRRLAGHMREAVAQSPLPASAQGLNAEFSESAAQLLELFSVQEEKKNIVALYRKTEAASAALERDMMESEDRFEISKHKTLDPSETAYVCTADTGDDSIWKRVLLKNISDEQFESIRNTIRGHVHNAAKAHFGFLMNGNYSDVFTYVFREVEQALAFVSDVYIKVNRTGTKYAHTSLVKGRDVFLFRAGVASGPMSSIYRSLDNGVLKCTGPAIRLSGTLCDLAESGEILAMEDVIRSFYSKKENLADTQYNIVKQGYQFIGSYDAPAVVHSVLPRPFAYRRPQLRNSGHSGPQNGKLFLPFRSVLGALKMRRDELPRQGVLDMMQQQLQRMESGELARMSAEDEYERSWEVGTMGTPLLRNPWLLLCQPQAEEQSENATTRRSLVRFKTMEEVEAELMYMRRPTKPLGFFFCDLAGAAVIARSLPPPLVRQVWAHYNFLVQSSIRDFGGYVAKTNSSAAYLVVFEEPAVALEAARQIQLEMTETQWPEELRSLEQTLHVRDMKTHQVLFNGPRPQMAVHVSDQYTWRMATTASSAATGHVANGNAPPAVTAVHLTGPGVEEAFVLGRHAHGGEIRLSRPLLEAVGAHPSGKLLLEQLSMDVVVAPSVVRVAEGGTGRVGSASNVSSGVTRRASAATPPSRKGAESKGEVKAVKTNVYAEECVVSVPRQLEGRLPLILPSASSAFGAAKLTERALALATASAAKGGPAEKDRAGSSTDAGGSDGSGTAAETPDSPVEVRGDDDTAAEPTPTSPARAVPLPMTFVSQHAWFVELKGAMNPLPAAWRTGWGDAASELPPNALSELGLLEETRKIQGVLQELLGLFPAAQRQTKAATLAVSDIFEEPVPDPTPTTADTTAAAAASGGVAGKKSAAAAADRRLPKIPAPPSAGRGGGSTGARRSKDMTTSSASTSTSAAAARAASRAAAIEQYAHFMDFTRCVVAVLANALDIGTDMRTPPPLPLPHGMHASDATMGFPSVPSAPGSCAGAGGSAGAQKYSRGSVTGRQQRSSPAPPDHVVPSSLHETSFSSLPSLPAPNVRTPAKSPVTMTLTSPLASRDSGPRERTASQLARGSFRVSTDRPFQSALDYLDDGCRALAQLSGAELGKLTALPPAPAASKSKAFSARSGSGRRN